MMNSTTSGSLPYWRIDQQPERCALDFALRKPVSITRTGGGWQTMEVGAYFIE
jgi:hypothetical protein